MCVNITNVLHENGYEVTLCASRAGGPIEIFIKPGIRFFILNKKHSLDLNTFRKLVDIVKKNQITVIHAHSSSVFWAVALKFLIKNIKVIWHDHLGLKVTERRTKFMYKLISGKIDAIIAVNEALKEWSRRNMKVPVEKIIVINNFPLLNDIKRNSNPDFFTIVCLANLRPQKDHETLVRAVSLLTKQDMPKKLKVVLAGSDDDKDYTHRIRQLVSDLNLEQIIEMPGTVEDVASLLAGADCGVLSSVSEGLPVALLEYGMAELPVVVTDVGQCAEVVGHGRYARLVSPGDAKGLADALYKIIMIGSEACSMGKSFREHVVKNYGPGKFMREYAGLLNTIT